MLNWNDESRLYQKDVDISFPIKSQFSTSGSPTFLNRGTEVPKSIVKKILVWNDESHLLPERTPQALEKFGCSISNCRLIHNRSLISNSDAVVFFGTRLPKRPPPRGSSEQLWIWFNMESPCHKTLFRHFGNPSNCNTKSPALICKWNNLFNRTMSYRKDSDIFTPYGEIFKRLVPLNEDYTKFVQSKTKLALWLVSNCKTPSKRMKYVKELRKYMSVDVYGKCGPLKCPHNGDCTHLMNQTYQFYLSFENSFATDYVTEKFFKVLYKSIIPVVRSGADFQKLGVDKDLFINTADFKSPKDLAKHLKQVASNFSMYVRYLNARNTYNMHFLKDYNHKNRVCKLCAEVNMPPKANRWYSAAAMYEWFFKGKCKRPTDLKFTRE